MIKGTVTEVLENVFSTIKFRSWYPVDAFATHLNQAVRIAVHPVGHKVTTDPRECFRSFGNFGRRIVWATGAKIGDSLGPGDFDDCALMREQFLCALPVGVATKFIVEPLRDYLSQMHGRQLAHPRDQTIAVFIFLTDHAFWFAARVVVEMLLKLAFDNSALFFDDKHFMFILDELQGAVWLERPDHADLVNINASLFCITAIDTEQAQRFHEVQVCLTGCYDAETCIGNVEYFSVDRIRRGEGKCRCFFALQSLLDLRPRKVRPAVVQAGSRRLVILGYDELPVGRKFDRHCGLDGFGDCLETDPHS